MEFTLRLFRSGIEKVRLDVLEPIGGKRRVPESEIKRVLGVHEERKIVGYARVLSHTQKDDLERQVELIKLTLRRRDGKLRSLKMSGRD